MDRLDVKLASCTHEQAESVRFATHTWGPGVACGASTSKQLKGEFEFVFDPCAHCSPERGSSPFVQ